MALRLRLKLSMCFDDINERDKSSKGNTVHALLILTNVLKYLKIFATLSYFAIKTN